MSLEITAQQSVHHPRGKKWHCPRALTMFIALVAMAPCSHAQTIRVDTTPEHSTNSIVPTRALGAGIDRLPNGAADKLYVQPTINQVLEAGWQMVSYRQNTELHMEAWHWNPYGTWSDPIHNCGYWTSDNSLGEPIKTTAHVRGLSRQPDAWTLRMIQRMQAWQTDHASVSSTVSKARR